MYLYLMLAALIILKAEAGNVQKLNGDSDIRSFVGNNKVAVVELKGKKNKRFHHINKPKTWKN